MTEFHDIRYTIADDVAQIVLYRPERMNALTAPMLEEIASALEAAQTFGARAVLLTGSGSAFCSGLDLIEAADRAKRGIKTKLLETHFTPLARQIAALSIPVVTAINGGAIGAGLGLALAGDIILACRSAYLLCAFVRIGAVPDTGVTWLLAKGAGRVRAMEMMMLGERMPAQEAMDRGMITRMTDDDMLETEALEIARKLAAGPTLAIGLIRQQVAAALSGSFDEALGMECRNQSVARASADFRESIIAFSEKRAPKYVGR